MADEILPIEQNSLDVGILAQSLVTLLALTSDAVLVFNAEGRILLVNSAADRLFRAPDAGLVGLDVRDLFSPSLAARGESLEASVPFPLDGTTAMVVCERSRNCKEPLSVRCERLRSHEEAYLLVVFASDPEVTAKWEHERLVAELSRANRRLSGTLRIVLETLDSMDVGTLFERVLGEISQTLDAWATLVYVADNDGFRLRGGAEALEGASVPAFVATSHPLAELMQREARPLRLRVLRPTREDLRRGTLEVRRVMEEDSLETVMVPVAQLVPFRSFVLCPVWFGGHTIATLVVGWRHEHSVADDDVRLLEAVSEYLSVQLAGAFASMRAQHSGHLKSLSSELRERLLSSEGLSDALVDEVFASAADGLDARCTKLVGNPHQRTTMAKLADGMWRAIPVDLTELVRPGEAAVLDVAEADGLVPWLEEFAFPTFGMLAALSSDEDSYRGYLVLRTDDYGPFEEADVAFVHTLAEDVRAIGEGERARTRDKRISQALQRGMRNELQRVDGLWAESCYCSATEEAYVGGDFYDLIRLPNRRACVIMGDVSGKGVEAASVSSAVKTALGAYAWEGLKPARMVSLLNDFLLGFSRVETFATLFVGIIDLTEDKLTYCSAGHPPALLVRAASGELVTLGVQSGVVGAFEGLSYRDGEVSLGHGDTLLLYTDGTTEARNPQGGFFGEDGLRDAVMHEVVQGFEGLCDRLLATVEDFAGGTLGDDVALVSVCVDTSS